MKMFNSFDTWLPMTLNSIIIILAICTLFVAIGSLITGNNMRVQSQKQFETNQENSQTQFDENTRRSQQMFEEQRRQSGELSEALMQQVRELQTITRDQLNLSDEQLKTQKELVRKVLLSTKPEMFILIKPPTIGTSRGEVTYSFDIESENSGARKAMHYVLNCGIINRDYQCVVMINPTPQDVHVGEKIYSRGTVTLPQAQSDVFYFALKYSIHDSDLDEEFINYRYLTKRPDRGEPFEGADDTERLRRVLDEALETKE